MKYPQSLFIDRLKDFISSDVRTITDIPCGDGQTTVDLARAFPDAHVIGVDINGKLIATANDKWHLPNLKFEEADVHNFVEATGKTDVFCLINSLFLLPNPEDLLRKITKSLNPRGKLLLILPNVESENFIRFQKSSPKTNLLILRREDYDAYFEAAGLKIKKCIGVAKIPTFGRWDTKLLYPPRHHYLFWLENRSKSELSNYYLIELTPIGGASLHM